MKNKSIIIALVLFSNLSILCTVKIWEKTGEELKYYTHAEHYSQYLVADDSEEKRSELDLLNSSISFWEMKNNENKSAAVYQIKLAYLLSQRFKMRGDISDLLKSDELFLAAKSTYLIKKTPVLHGLSSNAISQHKFKEALAYAEEAYNTGENKSSSSLLMFDAQMELGNVEKSKEILSEYPRKNSFEYMIRNAKMQDALGDLDRALVIMEKAAESLHPKREKELFNWAYSNLGDMYGHAGLLNKSYSSYLKVLENTPGYLYALKGISWIAYSKDRKVDEAKEILHFIASQSNAPDAYLLLAEIAEYENDLENNKKFIALYENKIEDKRYGDMYNKYKIELMLEDESKMDFATMLSAEEVSNRPTPQSYDLLAWTYYHKGEKEKAAQIAREFVEGNSFEPEIIYHLGMIYKGIDDDKSMAYLNEAKEASFELGPLVSRKINSAL